MPRNFRDDRSDGGLRLALAVAAAGVIWLVVLPWVGSWQPVREFVRGNEAAGINPSAVYYTEVEAMGGIAERWGIGGGGQGPDRPLE